MKKVILPDTRVETQYVKFAGGLDLASPILSIRPGSALEAVNYEPGVNGGYQRIDGYERFDGRPHPSDASYLYLEGEILGTITPGSTITGSASGATGIVLLQDIERHALIVSKVAGTFQRTEDIKINGALIGTITVTPAPRGYRDAKSDAAALTAAANLYRADIGPVPGSGPVRGVWMFAGVLYAFRDTEGGATCNMYRATPTGWSAVALGRQMQIEAPSKAVAASSGAITWPAHGLVAGTPMRLGGTLPTGVSVNTTYYIVNPTANAFQLAAAIGGTALALGDMASGLKALPQAQQIKEGAILTGTNSGATASVTRVGLRSGDWSSFAVTATITMQTVSGAFQPGELLTVAGLPVAGVTTADAASGMLPGGRFEFVTYNFTGASNTRRMYGCDGVNPAFEFDGATFTPILTGMPQDRPRFIAAHKGKLWLSFKGSVQHSGDGTPYAWTILSGADELGIGDDVTGMAVQAGDTLAIFGRNSSFQLNGSTNNDFTMLPISSEVGALPYTVQTVGKTFALDDRGIVSTDRTQAYGNFVQSTISANIKPIIDKLRTTARGSVAYRDRSQFRIFASDGSGVVVGFGDQGVLLGITRVRYPVVPVCFASCEDASGAAVVFFGADTGYVYQADRGSSFDGEPIECYLRMPFNNISSPRLRKRFRKAVMEISSAGYSAIRFQPEFSYGDEDIATHRLQQGETAGTGGYWDVDNWDEFYYDSRLASTPEFSIEGTGINMALVFYCKSDAYPVHTLNGMLIHFSIRRLAR